MEEVKNLLSNIATRFKSELILLVGTILIFSISLMIYFKSSGDLNNEIAFEDQQDSNINKTNFNQKIIIDLSGAVKKPNVYEVNMGSRLKDVISLAQGLSPEANYEFFSRNFNLARVLRDQDKIHVPSKYEIDAGIFQEQNKIIDMTEPQTISNYTSNNSTSNNALIKININATTANDLDTLPGIGLTTANKIIQNQPYKSIDELLSKKILKTNIFNQVKDLITVN